MRGQERAADVGRVLGPNPDWWWHDTCHMHAGDVQIMSSGVVGGGTGVYWMFYSGGSFEEVEVPAALQVRSMQHSTVQHSMALMAWHGMASHGELFWVAQSAVQASLNGGVGSGIDEREEC